MSAVRGVGDGNEKAEESERASEQAGIADGKPCYGGGHES